MGRRHLSGYGRQRIYLGTCSRRAGRQCKFGAFGVGILPVTVTVGDKYCSQSIVQQVPLDWAKPQRISVVRNIEGCSDGRDGERPASLSCAVLFRFVDDDEHSVGGVAVEVTTCSAWPGQQWNWSAPFGQLINLVTGLCLDVYCPGGPAVCAVSNGARVQLFTCQPAPEIGRAHV